MKKKLVLFMMSFACVLASYADRTIYVDPNGSDLRDGTTPENAIRSLTLLRELADYEGVTTVIFKENAVFEDAENISFIKSVKLIIEGNNAILKGKESAFRIMEFIGPTSEVKIKKLTLQDSELDAFEVGAALFFAGRRLEVDSCRFLNNSIQAGGGAIACRANEVIIRNSYFEGNKTTLGQDTEGGAILQTGKRNAQSSFLAENCTFYRNSVNIGSGSAIGFYDRTGDGKQNTGDLKDVRIYNCTFMENTTANPSSLDAGAQVHFDYNMGTQGYGEITYLAVTGILVNNTFYGEVPAVSLEKDNIMYFVNNVAVNMDDSANAQPIIKSDKSTIGQTTFASSNYLISLKMPDPERESDMNNGRNGNVLSQALEDFNEMGLETTLTTEEDGNPVFVPYLKTTEESLLVNAGTETYQVFTAEGPIQVIPERDIRGVLRGNEEIAQSGTKPDVGAYEQGIWTEPDDENSIINVFSAEAFYAMQDSGAEIRILNNTTTLLSLSIIQPDGKIVFTDSGTDQLIVKKSNLPKGLLIFLLDNGQKKKAEKVLF